jgi:hypothetical protein
VVGLVHQLDSAALVSGQPGLSPVTALQAEAQRAFGKVAAKQLTTGRLTTGQLTTGQLTTGQLTTR